MLRNINNFFNIIKNKRLKKTLQPNDMIAIGTRDAINRSDYQDTAISFADLEAQVATAGAQGVPGIQGIAGTPGATGLAFLGAFDNTIGYAEGDVVFFGGSSYVAKFAILAPIAPIVLPDPPNTDWDFLALQGLQGPQGVPGSGFSISDASRVVSVPTGGAQFQFREFLIPANSFAVGDVFNVVAGFIAASGTSGTFTYETYINTVPGLGPPAATSLFDIKMAASRRYMNTIQTFYIDGVGPTLGPTGALNSVTSGFTQYNNSGTNLSIDWTVDQYFIIAGRNASDRDVTNVGAKIF
jgi:hypothetical protein